MNRERLAILRDLLASLPDERFDIAHVFTAPSGENMDTYDKAPAEIVKDCGTAACIAGWTGVLFDPEQTNWDSDVAGIALGLTNLQERELFTPHGWSRGVVRSRAEAVSAIQSMLDAPEDDALPVWPEKPDA